MFFRGGFQLTNAEGRIELEFSILQCVVKQHCAVSTHHWLLKPPGERVVMNFIMDGLT